MDAPSLADDEDCLIRIEGLQLQASIGIYPHEQAERQPLLVDLALTLGATAATASDDIRHTVDYDAVVACVQAVVEARHYNLLETLSRDVLDALVRGFPLLRLQLTVSKPAAVPAARRVSITRAFDRTRPQRAAIAAVS